MPGRSRKAYNYVWELKECPPTASYGSRAPGRGRKACHAVWELKSKVTATGAVELKRKPPGLAVSRLELIKEEEPLSNFGDGVAVATPEVAPPAAPLIAAPPGLPPPPGLGDATEAAQPTFWVRIWGLPNELLTDCMMESILQQSGFSDTVVSFGVEEGKPCGEALVGFSSSRAAVRCAAHFQGCQWDRSGTEVATECFEAGCEENALTGLSAQELLGFTQPWALTHEGVQDAAWAGGQAEGAQGEQLSAESAHVYSPLLWNGC
jgi:hypothetical protein